MDFICYIFFISFFVVVITTSVAIYYSTLEAEKRLKRARIAYEKSLVALKDLPTSPDLRIRTLELGRIYSDLSRGKHGGGIFDEIALKNDIDAACASAVNVIPEPDNPTHDHQKAHRDEVECLHCAELILRKAKICKHCKEPNENNLLASKDLLAPTASAPAERRQYTCDCGKTFAIGAEHAGKRARCQNCKTVFRLPSN